MELFYHPESIFCTLNVCRHLLSNKVRRLITPLPCSRKWFIGTFVTSSLHEDFQLYLNEIWVIFDMQISLILSLRVILLIMISFARSNHGRELFFPKNFTGKLEQLRHESEWVTWPLGYWPQSHRHNIFIAKWKWCPSLGAEKPHQSAILH